MENTEGGFETAYDTRADVRFPQRPKHGRSLMASAARVAMVASVLAGLGAVGSGCLTRKVNGDAPTTKINYNTVVRQSAIDKIDLLFAIDNSSSMGDKQQLFSKAVPDLITRLLTPNCVDENGKSNGSTVGGDGKCAAGKPEFEPVQDLHIGIVSSSVGSRGSDACPADTPDKHFDDKAHLLNRGGHDGHSVPKTAPSNFLTWLPPNEPKNKDKKPVDGASTEPSQQTLTTDFADMVVGVRENGCGFEAQLESAYRFLVQPDPYKTVDKAGDVVTINGVDSEILKQRKDFLRPDSLVAIIMLTDENESSADPLALEGHGWLFESQGRVCGATSACATDPNSADCFSCYQQNARGKAECYVPGSGPKDPCIALDAPHDDPNVRFFHPKQRYGTDVRFPIQRYIDGFSKARVPNRDGEHPAGTITYQGTTNCTNPLFATDLPASGDPANPDAMCNLTTGPRTKDLIFFALIGGVPWELLTDPGAPGQPFKDALNDADWVKILGNDPLHYDFSGADPHMLESTDPRPGITEGEWDTGQKDLQYACTFPLDKERDCNDATNADGCDCLPGSKSPLCKPGDPMKQIKGKAYPTVSELVVAKSLGDQGIVASLCPRSVDPANTDYGYRPAVRTIVGRLKNALAERCIPQPLEEEADGTVPCLILELLPQAGDQATACDPAKGLQQPEAGVLARYRKQQQTDNADPADLQRPLCAVKQLIGADLVDNSCETAPGSGWCYVTRAKRGTAEKCAQAIKFSPSGSPPNGAIVNLQCIEQPPSGSSGGGVDAGGD